jgi:hypothetical protein
MTILLVSVAICDKFHTSGHNYLWCYVRIVDERNLNKFQVSGHVDMMFASVFTKACEETVYTYVQHTDTNSTAFTLFGYLMK